MDRWYPLLTPIGLVLFFRIDKLITVRISYPSKCYAMNSKFSAKMLELCMETQ